MDWYTSSLFSIRESTRLSDIRDVVLQLTDELPASVRAFHLAVPKQVDLGQKVGFRRLMQRSVSPPDQLSPVGESEKCRCSRAPQDIRLPMILVGQFVRRRDDGFHHFPSCGRTFRGRTSCATAS